MFAERGVVMLDQLEQAAAMQVDRGLPARALADVLRAKLDSEKYAKVLRPLIFPEDDDV